MGKTEKNNGKESRGQMRQDLMCFDKKFGFYSYCVGKLQDVSIEVLR